MLLSRQIRHFAEAFFELGRHEEAEELLAALTSEAATDEERARVANARAHNLSNYLDRQDDAAAVVAGAMATVDLVGRTEELQALTDLIAQTAERGAALLVVGEPGIGKSTLIHAAARAARAAGRRVLSTTGVETIQSGASHTEAVIGIPRVLRFCSIRKTL